MVLIQGFRNIFLDNISAKLLVMVCLFHFLLYVSGQQHSCVSHPVSLSNITNCYDKVCNLTATTYIKQQFDGITETCIDFTSGNNSESSTIHILGSKTVATYPLQDCYFTDDPYMNFTLYCSCLSVACNLPPLSLFCESAYNQATCPIHNTTSPSVFDKGVGISTDCLGGLKGHWCSRMILNAAARYKICRLGKPKYSVLFNIHDDHGNVLLNDIYTGGLISYNSSSINLTMNANLNTLTHENKYIIWDRSSNSNYYILPDTVINDINTYNKNKIGWIKIIENKIYHQLTHEDFDITLGSCIRNQFDLRHSLLNVAVFLNNHKQFLGNTVGSDRSLMDPLYNPEISDEGITPNHFVSPYKYVHDGFGLYAYDNSVTFFGVQKNLTNDFYTLTFKPDISIRTGLGQTTLFSDGTYDYTYDLNCLQLPYMQYYGYGNRPNYICILLRDTKFGFATCPQKSASTTDGVWLQSCTNYNGTGISIPDILLWPENQYGSVTFNGNFSKTINSDLQGGSFYEYLDSLVVDMVLQYSNISIQFTSYSTKPKIFNCVPFYDSIKFQAFSTSSAGSCYVEVQPLGLIETQSIYLSNNQETYTLDIIGESFIGEASIILKCFRSTATCTIDLNYVTNTTFTGKDSIFKSIGITANPINTIMNIGHYFDWVTEYIPWDIVFIVLYVSAGIILIIIIYYLSRYLWRSYGPYREYYSLLKFKYE